MRAVWSFAIIPLLCVAEAQEDGENPEYKAWASFRPGSWVKHRLVEDRPGDWIERETTCRLIDVTPIRAALEVEVVKLVYGIRMGAHRDRLEIPARVGIDRCPDPVEDREVNEGDEELVVSGRTLKCHWVEIVELSRCGKSTSKAWSCREIPGGIVNTDGRYEESSVVRLTKTLIAWSQQ